MKKSFIEARTCAAYLADEILERPNHGEGKIIEDITTSDLWKEIARRFNVRFGKIQMSIHDGRPSKFANVDLKFDTEINSIISK